MVNNLKNNNKLLFVFTSLLFAIALCFSAMFGDDLYLMHIDGNNLIDYWNTASNMYSTWSSRVLINFLIYFFTNHNIIYWALLIGISMYSLLYSLSKLFGTNDRYSFIFIVFVIMFFPFKEISTAGWISTTVTYFSPVAFGFLGLIPIKKQLYKEEYKVYEYFIYSISLIFACSNEQVMALLLACYVIGTIYLLFNKKCSIFFIFQLLIVITGAIVVLLCPGNSARKASEIAKWFPTFNSINIITKLDICFSTTMKWLLFDTAFFPLFTIILTYLMWRKYKDSLTRLISLVPSVVLVLCNYLKNITSSLFPYLSILNDDIPFYGLVNAGDINHTEAFVIYFVWILIMLIVIYEIIKLSDSLTTLLASLTLVGAGFITRMAMTLSPTIYASGYRTCAVFMFSLMACLILQVSKSKIDTSKFKYILLVSIILNFINFTFIIATTVA